MTNGDLDVQVVLQTPTGWVSLQDPLNGYELHKDNLAQRATSHRKTEITSEWVEGSYPVRSVRETVTESIVVWVDGDTPFQLKTRVKRIEDGFDQLYYGIVVTTGDAQETWSCHVADHVMETQAEFQHATTAIVRATVPRLPSTTMIQVTP